MMNKAVLVKLGVGLGATILGTVAGSIIGYKIVMNNYNTKSYDYFEQEKNRPVKK